MSGVDCMSLSLQHHSASAVTTPKETNETTGALILAVAGAVLGFSESDELLIIDVSEDAISKCIL